MKIGLLGFSTHEANKGCEALTYSFINILKNCLKDNLDIHFFFCGNELGELPKEFPGTQFTIENVRFKDWKLSAFRALKKCDVVFDVTCGDGFSDIYLRRQVMTTTRTKLFVEMVHTPLVLLPQTYGPFNDKELEKMAGKAIRRAAKVYSRDQVSSDYVKKIANRDAFTTTDIAFALPFRKKRGLDESKTQIGINISGLLWRGGFVEENQFGLKFSYQDYVQRVLLELEKDNQYEVHLIPHVIESETDCLDGDAAVCEQLANEHNVHFSGRFKTPVEAKNYIAAMDFFTGARMHSTIAALSAGVPVLPFSYSRKFEGLFGSLEYPWVLSAKTIELDQAVAQTLKAIENRSVIEKDVKKSMNIVQSELDHFQDDLKQYLNSLR